MSVVAKYCEECGLKIPQEHFEDGRAISYLYLSYCENCKMKVEKLYNAFQEFASFEAAEEKKSFIYQILVLVVVAVIVAVLSFFVSRGITKSGARKEIAAVEDKLKKVEADSITKIQKARDAKTDAENKLKKALKKGLGTPEELKQVRLDLKLAREQLDTANGRISALESERDNERLNAETAREEAQKWKEIAENSDLGEVPDLKDEIKSLKKDLAKVSAERDKALEDLLNAAGKGTTPEMEKYMQELEIRRLILAWVNAINGRDAATLKKMYSRGNTLSRNSVGSLQSSLDSNEGTLGIRIINIEVDTTTAVAKLDVKYTAGKYTDRKSSVQMNLSKELDKWHISKEGF